VIITLPYCAQNSHIHYVVSRVHTDVRHSSIISSALPRRKAVLPLVSRRWARALAGPSHAWRDVSMGSMNRDDTKFAYAGEREDKLLNAATGLAWFKSRPG